MNNYLCVLVVEDEKPLRTALAHKLQQDGMHVLEAQDGEEGLRIAQEQHPDAILLDLLMPRMDGATMLERLRQDEWGRNVPIVIVTNLQSMSQVLRVLEGEVAQAGDWSAMPDMGDEQELGQYLERYAAGSQYDFVIKSNSSLEQIAEKVKAKLRTIA